ncbi:hypothetical protein [Hwangdonia sp.]|uniref:hypothetical protein n=1 Tax=Hwangdonia sp. TaxID=1883432 RepID=UPI003AB13BFC
MNTILTSIQDTLQVQDTTKIIKAAKLFPATKIESKDGAIIPKEAVAWAELQPAFPSKNESGSMLTTYIIIAVVLIIALLIIKFVLKKRKLNS